jgi:UDP:flavonoid glycosyltransferase YjiC (YdhE family)
MIGRMRFLFSCMPWEGHFRPLVPLAHALVDRGHEVAFATARAWAPRVEEEGLTFVAAGMSQADGRLQIDPLWGDVMELPPEARRPRAFATIFARVHAPARLPELLEAASSWRADAIVYDSCELAAPIVAAALGVPSVNHSFGVAVPLAALEAAREFVDPLWRAQGLEPDPHVGAFRGLYIDLSPPSFAWERLQGEVVRLRPITAATGAQPEWLVELEPPLLYVTMGTVHNRPELFRPLLDGLESARGYGSALVTLGRDNDPAALGPVPARVRVEGFVPQAHVLPLATAVVCHGGSGTTLGALAHGAPLVLVPQAADQFDNAARAEAAGAAVVLRPGEVTGESVSEALERVLGEAAYRDGAAAIAREIEGMGDAETVAAAVEEHAARR